VTRDLVGRRNWASGPGGAAVRSFTGPDYGFFGCGPPQAIDEDPTTGWSSDAPANGGGKQIVVTLPADITVTGVAIDPSPACGDPAGAELRDFRVKVARDDAGDPGPFTTVASGTFGPADLGDAHDVSLSGSVAGARYLELQALSNNGDPLFMDVSELHVFGHATTPAEGGAGTAAPEVTTEAADPAAATSSSATFRATVTPHGASTVVRVAFGLASGQLAYQTADVPVVGDVPQTLALAAGGLLANTTYYYRAIATNSQGTATGDELTVTTKPAVPAQPAAGSAGAAQGPPGPAGPAARIAPVVKCTLRGRRTIACTFSARAGLISGARARLTRRRQTLARGVVHARTLRMVAKRDVRAGSYVLTTVRGRGRSAFTKHLAVKLNRG
jgi:hypothetical protein